MTYLTKTALIVFTALNLTACGGDSDAGMNQDKTGSVAMDDVQMDNSSGDMKMDHSSMDHAKTGGDTGHTTGRIVSISPDGKEVTISHQAIDGVGMGAMTMGFGILSTVDLSPYSQGDNVSFMVKKGRDNSYRITAICDTDKSGEDCLASIMQHSD